ncbi:conserved protein of unknown function [Magnetospirillum gryphiswaldense MSR-1 v2]|uniref:Uncharacterized protein n=2 Tax=Magnetospirillum gryphiswaldense TaxID=55518 RepID=V6F2F7_MAGGM|nr:hypothetical protein [Magnetospirillum gryphiswaldense]CAM78232.1 conserved hypothetical protein [Magnetospirillum gryphiswaldense MSR-1]CDK99634.1 conserved protein of unknown function [Magnetospirillum gryphiswaldense MSR-1 v2]
MRRSTLDAALIQMEVAMNIRVGQYREAIDHLFHLITVDYCACVGLRERTTWAGIARKVLAEVEQLECLRAKADDRRRHARCILAAKARLSDFPDNIALMPNGEG